MQDTRAINRFLLAAGLRIRSNPAISPDLCLDPSSLEEAVRLSGERTYSGVVQRALGDYVRRIRAGRILALGGRGLWEGSLTEMRRDRPARRARSARGPR